MAKKEISDSLKIKKIAEAANVSEMVVKRALCDYRNISPESKKKVLKVAEELGLSISTPSCDVAIILPAMPEYFWFKFSKFLEKYAKESKLKYRFFSYTSVKDYQDLLHCIEKAENAEAKVYIIVGQKFPQVEEKITCIAKEKPVILLEEYLEIENTCYVGENSFESGYELCKLYFEEYSRDKKILVVRSSIDNGNNGRLAGFCKALEDMNMPTPSYVDVQRGNRIVASAIARKLSQMGEECDCIYSPSGYLSECCNAVIKLKSNKEFHCIGFESNKLTNKYCKKGLIKLIIDQDMEGQSREAICLASECLKYGKMPDKKCVYVKSKPVDLDELSEAEKEE